MRNLILVVLVLQLVLTLPEVNGNKFGELISFVRKCTCLDLTYKHWAIYVDDVDLPGKKKGQDIFHRIGPHKTTGDCGFGVLANEQGTGVTDNYLDKYFKGKMGTAEHIAEMEERIKYWQEKGGTYNGLTNNCEHLATDVRYGYKVFRQTGTSAERACSILSKVIPCSEFDKLVKDMEENEKRREDCDKCSSSKPKKD